MRALYGVQIRAANDDARHRTALPTPRADNHDSGMSDAALIDAKIAAAEARGETRVTKLEGKLDTFAASMNGRFDAMFAKLDAITSEQARQHGDINTVSAQVSGAKTTVIITAIASVIAIVGALIGILAYGGDQLGRGMEVRKAVDEAIQETIKKTPVQPVTIETDGAKK